MIVLVVIPRDAKGDVRPAELCFETSEIYPRYLCLLCNMAVLTPQMAHYHLLRHQPDHCVPLATNVCPVCLSTVANREELVMHLHSLHSVAESANIEKKQSDFTCEVCGSVLTSFVFYENHMVRIHKLVKIFINEHGYPFNSCFPQLFLFQLQRGKVL